MRLRAGDNVDFTSTFVIYRFHVYVSQSFIIISNLMCVLCQSKYLMNFEDSIPGDTGVHSGNEVGFFFS